MASPQPQAKPAAQPEAPPVRGGSIGGLNDATAKRQKRLLYGGGGGLLLIITAWSFWPSSTAPKNDPDTKQIAIASNDMVNRNLSEKEWIALSSNRLDNTDQRLKVLEGQGTSDMQGVNDRITALQQENQQQKDNAQRVISAYESENKQLRATAASSAATPASAFKGQTVGDPFGGAGAMPVYGGGSYNGQSPSYAGQGGFMPGAPGTGGPGGPGASGSGSEVKLMSFTGGSGSSGSGSAGGAGGGSTTGFRGGRPDAGMTIMEDSPEYLPPNSYAPARVLVGVDASAGVNSQTDPLPVVLRITGPARSVIHNGKVLTTRIEGCVVNGAARGDLSSEKVYVKLAKMTCDQPGGRVAVSEVKGFISFGGKAGVRGRVVSREGALVGQALIAGIAAGFGRGFSANANAAFSGVAVASPAGRLPQLSGAEIAKGGLGEGVATAGDEVSKYLIERAEQYQPVIEMPTGIDVEIVFLDGVYVRSRR